MSATHPTNAIIDFDKPWYHYLTYFANFPELDATHTHATHGHAPAINAINITISFFIAYEIYIINFLLLPIFFQTTSLKYLLLFHFILHILLVLHDRV